MTRRLNLHCVSINCARFVLTILLVGTVLAGCRPASPAAETSPSPATAVEQPGETPTNTLPPSPTSPPGMVLLVSMPDSAISQAGLVESRLATLAEAAGLRFEARPSLSSSDLTGEVRIVVVVGNNAELAGIAAARADIQFLAIGAAEIQPTENISVIAASGERPDRQGFLAGYLAAVITQDWRIGVISLAGTPAGSAARLGFVNGVIFFCGLCRPVFPPFYQYPLYVEVPADASQAEQQAAADLLISSAVKTVYLAAGAGDEALYTYLAQAGVNIIGSIPLVLAIQDRWAATVQADLLSALEQAWEQLIHQQGGLNLDAPITLADVNSALLSPGRQRLVEKMLEDLLADFIDTGVDPLTGTAR